MESRVDTETDWLRLEPLHPSIKTLLVEWEMLAVRGGCTLGKCKSPATQMFRLRALLKNEKDVWHVPCIEIWN